MKVSCTSSGLGRSTAAGSTRPSTGYMSPSDRRYRKSRSPKISMASAGRPSSSKVSRRAHCRGVSPASIRPPGKHTSPLWWCSFAGRTSYKRLSPSGPSTSGTSTAYSPRACCRVVRWAAILRRSACSSMLSPPFHHHYNTFRPEEKAKSIKTPEFAKSSCN